MRSILVIEHKKKCVYDLQELLQCFNKKKGWMCMIAIIE